MLLLQAGYHSDKLFLWAETTTDSASAGHKTNGRRGRGSLPAISPYDPGADALIAALAEIEPYFTKAAGKPETAVVWLPSVHDRPAASSPLISEFPEKNGACTLAPWSVTAIPLDAAQALDLLSACVGEDVLRPGLIVGKTLAFWANALRFAGALGARQQFLPSFDDKTSHARWQPIFAGADNQRLTQLAKVMPPASRVLTLEAAAPPEESAISIVTEFVSAMVDALVRSTTASDAQRLGRQPASRAAPSFESAHDQWLHALRSADGAMTLAPDEAAKLAEELRQWQRPITVSTRTPFRLCFRLEEPADANGAVSAPNDWYLRYLLQAVDDPSLLVPVADAWSPGRKASVLRRRGFEPREYLLTALGDASKLFPEVDQSLKTSTPSGLSLDASGAHGFLTEKAWLLEQTGFGVLLPAWWTRKGTKQRLTLSARVDSPKMRGGGALSLQQLVQFRWEVALGDQTLSLAELKALAQLKEPLVRVRGQWVQLNAEEIQAALDFWQKGGKGRASVRDVVRMALGGAAETNGLEVSGVVATGWINDFLAELNGRRSFEEVTPPQTFHGTLRPYQVRGYSWLHFLRQWGLGACLADDMGLGKTVQALALIEDLWAQGERRPTLLVCPMSVVGNWQKEAARFTPDLPVLVHHGGQRRKGSAFEDSAKGSALVVSSYALLHRDADLFQKVPWQGVILDEAQNIKNPQTKQAKAARALRADYRVALTGTPVENHVGDLWSIMEFLNPGLLGKETDFKRSFFVPIQAGHDPEAARRLQRLTGPFILRRLKTDKTIIADLPDKLEMKVFCTLTKEQASLYAAVVEDAAKALKRTDEGIKRKGVILATLSKLKQVCNHPAQFLGDNSAIPERSGKLARLTEMLGEALATGDCALVFTQFSEMGAIIQRHLQGTFGREVLFLHGGTTKRQRDVMINRFQASENGDAPRVFVLSLKAGGTGLNLTAANHVFHFDRWWNPAVENQATDRAFRIGQTRNVQVHKFLCVGTLEEKIDEMIESKKEIAGRVVGTGEAWLTELSNEQLKDLFALRKEALGE
jgi:SNF2 family DNA or RNA helicase